jgi:hypothetical protein
LLAQDRFVFDDENPQVHLQAILAGSGLNVR